MHRKKIFGTYLIIFAVLLTMMSLSRSTSNNLRGRTASISAPFWEKILRFKYFILHPFQPSPFGTLTEEEEKQKLHLENHLLKTENTYLQRQLHQQQLVVSQLQEHDSDTDAMQMTAEKMKRAGILELRMKAVPARVIFRSFDTWHEALWINVGETSNQGEEFPVVALNSPVVAGTAIVGIVDYVGEEQSRVRLISDSRLTPSVRASRGGEQDFMLSEQIMSLEQQLDFRKNELLSSTDRTQLLLLLNKLKHRLNPLQKTWHLAKGELLGSNDSSRIGEPVVLKGTGFNYDFPDDEGSSRDLRSGESTDDPKEPAIPILKVNDILTTTGMDGIFPVGFQVATVTKIGLLKEGDYFYELEATPIASHLEELSLVFVLPPIKKHEAMQN